MESSHQARKIVGYVLLVLAAGALGLAYWEQQRDGFVQHFCTQSQEPLEITVLTKPAMFISHNVQLHQANVRVLAKKSDESDPLTRTEKLLQAEKITPTGPVKFFEPTQEDRETYWEDFKYVLSRWRYNPLLMFRAAWAYAKAWLHHRTNLSPAEFIFLAQEMTQLEANDFTVRFPPQKQAKKKKVSAPEPEEITAPDRAPLALKDRPVIVEILNASGQKGLALALTQYLREQNTKGLLRVDVLQYDNYPSQQETSWIENYTGQPVQLKQLGNAIGITGEIRVGNAPNVICDTRIILGKDFKMPL